MDFANHNTEETMQPYHHFTLIERDRLRGLLEQDDMSLREIARKLGYNVSSISRELKRNRNKDGTYTPWRGATLYIIRRKHCVRAVRVSDEEVRAFVVDKLKNACWSPEIIAEQWKQEHPVGPTLSAGAIYRAIRQKWLTKEEISAKTHLRRHGKHQNKHNSCTIKPEHTIHDRPEIIERRARIGDLEGDTVLGGVGKGCVATLVDRKSRMLYAAGSPTKGSAEVTAAFKVALAGVPVESITLDNGSEFALFRDIERNHQTTVYFADTHSPWQRGSNENVNGLLRFFFPKGTDFRHVTPERLRDVVGLINDRPRKCLGWLSPREFLSAKCCT
jgi:IS30 family transposase